MHSQDDVIGPLISSNQLEKCLKLGTLICVIPTPAYTTYSYTWNVKSTVFGFQLDAMIASYCFKTNRVVNMLSTMHSQPKLKSTSDQKPSIILFYNKAKGDCDSLDKMVRSHSTKKTTRRWLLVLFYYVIDVSTINAFIIGKV